MNGRQGLIILAVILGLAAIGSGIWGLQQSKAKNTLLEEKEQLGEQLGDLSNLKDELAQEVDSLQREYEVLAQENESLQGSLTEAEQTITNKNRAIRNAKSQSVGEINNLRAEIQELIASKSDLEASIDNLRAENDSLRTRTGILEMDLSQAKQDNEALANLNRSIQGELKQLTLANFKASAFQVETEMKSKKATSKARRARRIRVTFDLANVPEEYQGVRTLYMAITNDQAIPIKVSNPIKTKVVVNGQQMDLFAVSEKDVNIAESQRLNFTHELENKLKGGYYRVAVYTDIGLLGASTFRLR